MVQGIERRRAAGVWAGLWLARGAPPLASIRGGGGSTGLAGAHTQAMRSGVAQDFAAVAADLVTRSITC